MSSDRKNIVDVLSSLEYEELIELQRELFYGAQGIKQYVNNKLKVINASESRTCGTCGSEVNLRQANEFTLIFGPPNSKSKASFCALDCMDYFTSNLKQLTSKGLKKPV